MTMPRARPGVRAPGRDRAPLPRGFEAAARLSIDGHTSAPFTLRTLAPTELPERSLREEIVAASRERHGTPVAEIDAALELALGKGAAATTEEGSGAEEIRA